MRAKRTSLTAERVREVLDYDQDTGVLTWRVTKGRIHAGTVAGGFSRGYRTIAVDGHRYFAHRLAWLHATGEWPDSECLDHRDGDRSNNAFENLRMATIQANNENRRVAAPRSATGLLGAFPAKAGRFQAQICLRRKVHHLGTFDTKEQAHQAYLAAKRRIHDGCTL